jgi:nickel-type superoxide dismutase maturation protease
MRITMRPAIWPLHIYRVSGESMRPTYAPGDTLLGWRWFKPRPGHVVVAYHEGRSLIKRVVSLDVGGVWIEGDNPPQSTDSRHFGPLGPEQIQARIIVRLGLGDTPE